MIDRIAVALQGLGRPIARALAALQGFGRSDQTGTAQPLVRHWTLSARARVWSMAGSKNIYRFWSLDYRNRFWFITSRPRFWSMASRPRFWTQPVRFRFWVAIRGAVINTLVKRTRESVSYDINCANMLSTGETISSVTSVFTDNATTPPLAFGTPSRNSSATTYPDGTSAAINQAVRVTISGGQANQTYTVRAEFTTSAGNQMEATVLMQVSDTAN